MTTAVTPSVGIVMGSSSDLPVMGAAADQLTALGVSHELRVVSAHRTPTEMVTYGRTAAERGLQVIVAGAGGAAHLPGMLAALTTLPVIGVPVPLRELDGLDSLLSIVQMPTGVPVGTVGIGRAANAALLAARIVALTDPEVAGRLQAYARDAADKALRDDLELQEGQRTLERRPRARRATGGTPR